MESEKEFLQKYNMNDYERPSVTSDIIAFTIKFTEEDSYRHNPDAVTANVNFRLCL